jgi:protein-S-isoprenylcysteine O-methyltransferase Ste14
MSDVLQDLFTNKPVRKFLFKIRYLLAVALVVPLARYMHPEWLGAAVGISLLGQAIQAWCFASLVKNRELSVRGPYLLVRNPMYLGRFFLILGFICLLDSWIAIVAYTVLYYPYMLYRVKREERRLRRAYPDEFGRYCSEVRRFLPSLGRLGEPAVRFFDWAMFRENNGHWNILLTLAAYLVVYAIHLLFFT